MVGVTVELLDKPWYDGPRRFQLFTDYLPCLRAAGLRGLLLPTDGPPEEAAALLDRVDGLLLTGGDDADLRPLGGPAPEDTCKPVPPEQQALNLALVEEACARDMPLLGVCFGMQMMGLAHGARFIQHLDGADGHVKGVEHAVAPVAGTRLAEVVGEAPFAVPSYHHQALADPGPQLRATAVAPEWQSAKSTTSEASSSPPVRSRLCQKDAHPSLMIFVIRWGKKYSASVATIPRRSRSQGSSGACSKRKRWTSNGESSGARTSARSSPPPSSPPRNDSSAARLRALWLDARAARCR